MSLTTFDEIVPQFLYGVMRSGDFGGENEIGAAIPNVLRVDSLWSVNTDSAANVIILIINGVEVASVAVPARAGYDGNPPADVLLPLSTLSGWPGLVLPSNTQLKFELASAPADGQMVVIWGVGGLIPTTVGL